MKIILHGATNGSNFGDFLFAELFYKKLLDINKDGKNIFFEFPKFGISKYFKKYLNYNTKQSFKDLLTSDLLIYISGGYFGERNSTFKDNFIRLIRYIPIGLLFKLRKKPIFIIGVGGGPISNRFIRRRFVKLINYSSLTTVRDEETANYFYKNGAKKKIIVTSDTAQIISKEMLPQLEVKENLIKIFNEKKKIYLHIYGKEKIDNLILDKIVNPLNDFLKKNKDYGVIIGSDNILKSSIENHIISKSINCESKYYYEYNNPWQLCSLLNEVDLIITPKLHVGIIGCALSKSILSFPMHYEKTYRYYKQINELDRVTSIYDLDYNTFMEKIIKYHDKPIILSKEIISKAFLNLNMMEQKINELKKDFKNQKH